MTKRLLGKLLCLIKGHSWHGGTFHISENDSRLNYDLRYCGNCDREYVHID